MRRNFVQGLRSEDGTQIGEPICVESRLYRSGFMRTRSRRPGRNRRTRNTRNRRGPLEYTSGGPWCYYCCQPRGHSSAECSSFRRGLRPEEREGIASLGYPHSDQVHDLNQAWALFHGSLLFGPKRWYPHSKGRAVRQRQRGRATKQANRDKRAVQFGMSARCLAAAAAVNSGCKPRWIHRSNM